jgi:hypothetical protein
MKTIQRLIPVAVVFVLVAALLAQATMSEGDAQSGVSIAKAFANVKITDRMDYFSGAFFANLVIAEMHNMAFRTFCDGKHILPGLEGVQVEVVPVRPDFEKYGLTQQVLQTDTELRLRQHGIRIFTDEEANQSIVEQKEKGEASAYVKGRSIAESLEPKDSDEHFLQCLTELLQDLQRTSSPPPCLYINVNPAVLEDSGLATFSINVELRELWPLYTETVRPALLQPGKQVAWALVHRAFSKNTSENLSETMLTNS